MRATSQVSNVGQRMASLVPGAGWLSVSGSALSLTGFLVPVGAFLFHSCRAQLLSLGFSLYSGCLSFTAAHLFYYSVLYGHKETQPDPGAEINTNAYRRCTVIGDKTHPPSGLYIFM